MSDVAAIILAAGGSTRMGQPKQLLQFRGRSLLRNAVGIALSAGCEPVVAVLGAHYETIRADLDSLAVEIVSNPRWQEGMGTSIQSGLAAVAGRDVSGVVIMLGDQPLVPAAFVRAIIAQHCETGAPIVAARYSGTAGVPVFFARSAFPSLLGLAPHEGCKGLILGNTDSLLMDCPEAALDIDTPDDYEMAKSVVID